MERLSKDQGDQDVEQVPQQSPKSFTQPLGCSDLGLKFERYLDVCTQRVV